MPGIDVDDFGREPLRGIGVSRNQRPLAERKLRKILFIDADDQLRLADRCQQHRAVCPPPPRRPARRCARSTHRPPAHGSSSRRASLAPRAAISPAWTSPVFARCDSSAGWIVRSPPRARRPAPGSPQRPGCAGHRRASPAKRNSWRRDPVVRWNACCACLRLASACLALAVPRREFPLRDQLPDLRFGLRQGGPRLGQRGQLVAVWSCSMSTWLRLTVLTFPHRNAHDPPGHFGSDLRALRGVITCPFATTDCVRSLRTTM